MIRTHHVRKRALKGMFLNAMETELAWAFDVVLLWVKRI